MSEKIKVFISYSWDSEEHKEWVGSLADALEQDKRFSITFDQYDLDETNDRFHFMEQASQNSDKVLVICTENFRRKSNDRLGGVGVEAYMLTAQHFTGLSQDKKSKIVALKKDKSECIPTYLQGQIYVDFSNDNEFESSINYLKKVILGETKRKRPQKKSEVELAPYYFTRVEDILKISHRNRECLITAEQSKGSLLGKRIKYELWKTQSPSISYFLMLFPNINIRQTIENVIEKIKELRVNINEITILKTTESKNNYIRNAFNEKYSSITIHEYSYSEYVWNYCIEDICKKKFEIDPVPNYIEQSIILNKNNDIEEIQDNVVQYLVKEIKENTFPSSRLIVGPGGIGKSSLCMELVKKLNTDFENKSVLLIMSENIRSLDNVKTLIQNNVIDSLYKLYNLYMNLINSEVNYDQKTFELSILCGNLIIIIDGLDEFVSIFQEQFDTNEFLKSIHDLHLELGQSLVILTSRKNEIIEKINLTEIGIERIDLLGFDKEHLEKYSRKYFKNIDNAEKKSQEFIESVNDFTQGEDNGRISPFMASIFAHCIKNDLYGTGKMKGLGKSCPIPYTNYLTREDFLVYQIFEREKVRHKLDFEISDIIDILSEIFVTNYSSKMSLRELLTQLEIIFDSRSIEILNKLKLNPFFDSDGEFLIVKNDFIVKYFSLLYLLDRFIKGHMTDSMKRIFSSSNFFESEYKNFINYCQNNKESCQEKIRTYILNFLQRGDLKILDKKVIGNLCNLYLNISSTNGVERVTEVTRELFNTSSEDKIYNLYIYGDYPALDFRDMKVSNSEFLSYPNFVKSRFNQNTLFAYSKFDLGHDIQYLNSEISNAKFESTCDLGNLHDKLKQIQSEKVSTRETILQELRKFLLPFFKGAYFTDVKKNHMYFSRTIKKLSKEKFDDFLKKLWIEIKIEKSDEIYYQINPNIKDSIRGFLTNNMPDDIIEDIVEYLES